MSNPFEVTVNDLDQLKADTVLCEKEPSLEKIEELTSQIRTIWRNLWSDWRRRDDAAFEYIGERLVPEIQHSIEVMRKQTPSLAKGNEGASIFLEHLLSSMDTRLEMVRTLTDTQTLAAVRRTAVNNIYS